MGAGGSVQGVLTKAAQHASADLGWPIGEVTCPLDVVDPETGEETACGGTKVYAIGQSRKDRTAKTDLCSERQEK